MSEKHVMILEKDGVMMNRGNKSASWNDQLDLEI